MSLSLYFLSVFVYFCSTNTSSYSLDTLFFFLTATSSPGIYTDDPLFPYTSLFLSPEQSDVQDKARALLKSRLTDMTAQKDELPPCPFCGNEPVLLTAT